MLLREALKRTKKIGVVKVVIRTRQYLAAIMVEDKVIVLLLLRFAQEPRHLSDADLPSTDLKKYKITQKEIEMADGLMRP